MGNSASMLFGETVAGTSTSVMNDIPQLCKVDLYVLPFPFTMSSWLNKLGPSCLYPA
jgi:hypothetical protein